MENNNSEILNSSIQNNDFLIILRRLEQAERLVEQAERLVEQERKAREEAEQLAEQERKAREEAERLAEQERKAREEERKEAEQLVEQERKAREEERKEAEQLIEQERKAREEAEQKIKDERCEGYLQKFGLPPLGTYSAGSGNSKPSAKVDNLDKVTRRDGSFNVLEGYELNNLPKDKMSIIWRDVTADKTLTNWNNEYSLQPFCDRVIKDIIELSGLKGLITSVEVYLEHNKVRPDILMLKFGGFLIGVCEVKRTSRLNGHSLEPTNDLSNIKLNGQIYKNLRATMYHGVKYPLGVVSTYNEWMFVWLPESDELAKVNNINNIKNIAEPKSSEKIIYCSPVFQRTNTTLIELLVSFVIKLANAPRCSAKSLLRNPNDISRKYAKIEIKDIEKKFYWQMLPTEDFKLQYKMPDNKTKYLYLLEAYHGGADGNVWLACNSGGHLLVIKYSEENKTDEEKNKIVEEKNKFDEEASMWREIWGQHSVTTSTVLKCNAMFMPFTYHALCHNGNITFKPLSHWNANQHEDISVILESEMYDKLDEDQFKAYYNDPYKVAKEAITEMANKGYIHDDLHWRHVALLPVPPSKSNNSLWTVKPILIDLHRVKKIDIEQNKDIIIDQSLKILEDELSKSKSN